MNNKNNNVGVYLKSNVKAEPIIWGWYAWAYLIPPVTAACNIVNRHLRIMESYIQAPHIHAQAVKNPKLLGGPFIDFNVEKVEEIAGLINETKKKCKSLIELENSYKWFDQLLQAECKGQSLETFYAKCPAILKGLVELVYDLNNNPSIRLIEPLIYNKFYSTSEQQVVLSSIVEDERPFVLSTPKIIDDNEISLNLSFGDPRLDKLFLMKTLPQDINEIESILKIPIEKRNLFHSFFTTDPPPLKMDRNFEAKGIRIRYFGHACVLIETKEVSILIDPVISYGFDGCSSRYSYYDLPDHLDYVLLTHNHQDHTMIEPLLQLRHKIGTIVCPANLKGFLADPSLKLILKQLGFKNVQTLEEMESIALANGVIMGIPFLGEHSDLNIQTKLGFYIKLNEKKLLFVADSANLEEQLYKYIFDAIGDIDILFIGMECDGAPLSWLYGPLLSSSLNSSYDKERKLSGSDFARASKMALQFNCKQAFVYAMGQEPWLKYVMALVYSEESPQIIESNKFIEDCNRRGINSKRLYGCQEWII